MDWVRKRISWGRGSDESTPVSPNDYGFHLSAFSESRGDDQSAFVGVEDRFFKDLEKAKELDKSPYSSSIFADDDRRGYLESKIDERRFMNKIKRRR